MQRARTIGIGLMTIAFASDQSGKALALASSALTGGIEVLPFLNVVLVKNTGVSFGMLGDQGVPWWCLPR